MKRKSEIRWINKRRSLEGWSTCNLTVKELSIGMNNYDWNIIEWIDSGYVSTQLAIISRSIDDIVLMNINMYTRWTISRNPIPCDHLLVHGSIIQLVLDFFVTSLVENPLHDPLASERCRVVEKSLSRRDGLALESALNVSAKTCKLEHGRDRQR